MATLLDQGFEQRLKKLNSEQRKAVETIEGPLLVVAGPGSGKTEILSLRVANILRQTQALPSNVLCLTFTESAALNMRERLSKLIGHEAYRIAIHTFHNFCVEIIQKYPQYFYGGAIFTPADPLSQIAILEEIFTKLSYDHPLRSVHPEQGFVYLQPIAKAIAHLKKAGLLPDEFRAILEHNQKSTQIVTTILGPIFDERLSKKSFVDIEKAVVELTIASKKLQEKFIFPSIYFHPLCDVVISSLQQTLELAIEDDSTKPLSAWKEKMFKKDEDGKRVFKDELNELKMIALAELYEKYRDEMHKRSLYDFDDMILDTISAIQKHPELQFDIQEQYQYILVDEFQDTNDAQMRLLRLIADAPVHEGRPNLMVVGDDDQAVYKFQGAELSNILDFKNTYRDVGMVTMVQNYRSTQDILDLASHIIKKGENRLENLIPEIQKTLVSSHPELLPGRIIHKKFLSSLHEYYFVSREIKRLIDEGHDPEQIAVISRKHKQLQNMVPFLQGAGVPLRYEREQNVFKEPHIEQLIVMSRFISTLHQKGKDEADEYMPAILSFPFWQIPRTTIWKISQLARRGQMNGDRWVEKTWLDVMMEHEDQKIRSIAELFLELGGLANYEALEKVLDMLIGAHVVLSAESEEDDEIAFATNEDVPISRTVKQKKEFVSPFKDFYFSKERFDHARAEYLGFLSSLRVFVQALREYRKGEVLLLRHLVEFVDLHEKNNIRLNDQSPFSQTRKAVHLLTAHKSKGLEFETVFVLSSQDDIWAGRSMGSKLSFPLNLKIEPAGDTSDDQLRLFYVALTRAKRNLYITSYDLDENGETSHKLRFLLPNEGDEIALQKEVLRNIYLATEDDTASTNETSKGKDGGGAKEKGKGKDKDAMTTSPETHEVLTASWLTYNSPPFFGEEESLLKSFLENYQISATHLNNYLNVGRGGPQLFFEHNLLRFPQAKSPSESYGSAIHKALEKLSVELRREGKIPTKETFIQWFIDSLRRERLSASDHEIYSNRGVSALNVFYNTKKDSFSPKDKTEVNFKNQGVMIQDAHLTGKIDRVVDVGGGCVEVHDYKTGKAPGSWQGKTDYEKIKLHEYERQLIFYKLLVENSRDFGDSNFKVDRGVIEFVEPAPGAEGKRKDILDLPLDLDGEKVDRTKDLISIVYKKIMQLDFPDVSKYDHTLKGILQFEDDLLAGM